MKRVDEMKRKELDNKGYSLLEVIIVAAILSVLLGVVFVGIKLINGRPVEECAKKIETSLKNNRVTTMGKLSASIMYGIDSENYVYMKETINGVETTQRIGEKGIEVYYSLDGGATWADLNPSRTYTVNFDRSTGGVRGLPTTTTKVMFRVKRGDKQMVLSVDKLTGRVSME